MPVRWLNLQEFQSKKLMADNGLHVQRFKVADNAKEAVQIAKELSKFLKNPLFLSKLESCASKYRYIQVVHV